MPSQPVKLPCGEYLPDMPDYENPGSSVVTNVYPRTPTSYGAISGPSVYSDALAARAQGGMAVFDQSSNVHLFAGDATKLYTISSGTSWSDVSRVSGYSCPGEGQWNFEYGENQVFATDYADAIQEYTFGSSTAFADLSVAAPKAKYIAFVKDFLVVAYTNEATWGEQPHRVWWAALGNPASWPTPGSTAAAQAQSGYNDILGQQGKIMGLVGNLGNADAAIFFEHAVWRMIYAGPPSVFNFYPAEGVRGCPAPNSIVRYGSMCYYLGEDGFYVFDGLTSHPIGSNKVDKAFYSDVDKTYLSRITGVADPKNKLIWFAYPGDGNVNGNPNKAFLFNWDIGRWSLVTGITLETIKRYMTIGYTLDELYTILGYLLDDVPASLDSSIWSGGEEILGTFDTNHKLNFLTGATLSPTVQTSEVQPFSGVRAKITNARAIVDGGTPSVSMGVRERQVDTVSYTSAIAMNSLGTSPVRTSGRYVRAQVTLPAGSSFTNITGVEITAIPAGTR